jgi:hypothetical protein
MEPDTRIKAEGYQETAPDSQGKEANEVRSPAEMRKRDASPVRGDGRSRDIRRM